MFDKNSNLSCARDLITGDSDAYCKKQYKKALKILEKKKYNKALELFDDILKLTKDNSFQILLNFNILTIQKDISVENKDVKSLLIIKNKFLDLIMNENNDLNSKIYKDCLQNYTHCCDILLMNTNDLNHLYDILMVNNENHLTYYNLGLMYKQNNIINNSINNFKLCINFNKEFADAYRELSSLYSDIGIYKFAKYYIDKYLNEVTGDNSDILNCKGLLLMKNNEFEESHKIFTRAYGIENKKESEKKNINLLSKICLNKGATYSLQGNMINSIKYYEKVLSLLKDNTKLLDNDKTPNDLLALGNILLNYNYSYANLEKYNNRIKDVRTMVEKYEFLPEKIIKHKNKQIHVGYVSCDLTGHAVSNFTQQLFNNYDNKKYKIFIYNNSNLKYENKNIEKIYNISHVDNIVVKKLILKDKIDILIDLSGHTAGNRLPIFALRCAPIQINYLGFPNITGIPEMDYRLVDLFTDGIPNDVESCEKLVRIQDSFLCYNIPQNIIPIKYNKNILYDPLKSSKENDYNSNNKFNIVLGCFNKTNKFLNPDVLETWEKLLKTLVEKYPFYNFVLAIKNRSNATIDNKYTFINKCIKFLPFSENQENHMLEYNKIHISLDTFPYNGTTTSCESLYMGVIPVTLANPTYHCHNTTKSILINTFGKIDSKQFISYNTDEYVEKTVKLVNLLVHAKDKKEFILNNKEKIRHNFTTGKVCNKYNFMKNYEKTLEDLYNDCI